MSIAIVSISTGFTFIDDCVYYMACQNVAKSSIDLNGPPPLCICFPILTGLYIIPYVCSCAVEVFESFSSQDVTNYSDNDSYFTSYYLQGMSDIINIVT